jgi:hypothetical protein
MEALTDLCSPTNLHHPTSHPPESYIGHANIAGLEDRKEGNSNDASKEENGAL